MKTNRLRTALIILGIPDVFSAGFFFGGVHASITAARGANAASLVYYTGIHDALERQHYEQAADLTNAAVDGHIGVLQLLDTHPWMASVYVLPWMSPQEPRVTSTGIQRVRESYESHLDQLQPRTRDYLAASR